MKKALPILSVILLLALLLVSGCGKQARVIDPTAKISSFSVADLPYDDGSGVVLKWKPLDKSQRVIQYNIYRGVSPDSLFFLSSVEVDPKVGVTASEMFFYDSGEQPLIEFETSPTKLKKEKQQAPASPLFRRFPLDAKLLGTMIGRYNVQCGINSSKLYKNFKAVKDGDEILAGLKLHNFEYIFGIPIPGQDYYYTILAVNEKGRYLPYADIKKISPQDDPPDPKTSLFSTYVPETGVINFEWTPPAASQDIDSWEGWLVPKTTILAGEDSPSPQENLADKPNSNTNWQAAAKPLFQMPNYNNVSTLYHRVDTKAEGIALPANMEDYSTLISYTDYAGQQAAALATHFRTIAVAGLPLMPDFKITDKKNDKGDNLVVSIDKPLAFVVSAAYTNNKKNTLRVNYDLAGNENYKVDKLKFTFLSVDGKEIGSVPEYFLDKTIRLKLPDKYIGLKDMRIRIAMETSGDSFFEPDYSEQHIVYDEDNKLFKSAVIIFRGETISKQSYDVLVKNYFAPDFLAGNKTNGTTRAYDYGIPYESIVYEQVLGVDKATKRITLDPKVSIAVDHENGYRLSVPFFRSKFEAGIKAQETEIATLKKDISAYPAGTAPDSLTSSLKKLEDEYHFITTNPTYLAAAKTKTPGAWLKTMLKTRKENQRSYAFKLLKSDGKGALVITDTYTDPKGNMWFSPKSEWFNSTMTYTLIATLLLCVLLMYAIYLSHRREVFIRPIAGLHEIDNAIGRATEMGKPVMFVPGWGTLGEPDLIAALMILSQIAKKTAEFDIRLISPQCDYIVLPLAQEIVQSAYSEVGRPDAYNQNDIFFISDNQFPFCAGVNGITVRERVATIFYMGFFNAEALLLTETGNQAGAIQIAGTDSTTQVPFFITTCDYTLIGEEFYAASAYLSRSPDLVSMLKAQDYFKLILVIIVVIGTVLSTLNFTGFINTFPVE